MTSSWTGRLERLLPIAPVSASFLVFVAVVGNGFYSDDFFHLYRFANGPLHLKIFESYAGHWLVSFNIVFAALQALFGVNSALYFLVVLLVHCANVRLLQSILLRTTGAPYLAAFGATLFGICPINAGSLGWLSVLGHVVATAAVLFIVRDLVRVQQRESELDWRMLVRTAVLLLIASSSFGSGLGIAVGSGVILFIWNPTPERRTGPVLAMLSVGVAIALIYFGTGQLYYSAEVGSVVESPATYIEHLPELPTNVLSMLLLGMGSLLGGPLVVGKLVPISTEWLLPVTFAIGAAGFAAVALAFATGGSTFRRRSAALGVLVCCGYGVIALARFWLFELEISRPISRYHYLGPAIFSLILCLTCRELSARVKWPARHAPAIFYGWLAVAIVPYALAVGPTDDPRRLEQKAKFHTAALELQRELERGSGNEEVNLVRNEPVFTTAAFGLSYAKFPDRAALFIILHDENRFDGVPVRFIEPNPGRLRMLLEAQVEGSRMSELLSW